MPIHKTKFLNKKNEFMMKNQLVSKKKGDHERFTTGRSPDPFTDRPSLLHPIKSIERGDAIGFGHCGIVEGGVDEVHERIGLALLCHDGLSNVDDFRCLRAETVDAQNFKGFAVEDDFEHAGEPVRYLCPRDMAKVGVAHFVGDFLGC